MMGAIVVLSAHYYFIGFLKSSASQPPTVRLRADNVSCAMGWVIVGSAAPSTTPDLSWFFYGY